MKVKYDDNTEHFYALSVNGDVSGDAKIELDDIMKIAKQIYTTQNELKGVYLTAADYDNDDNLTLADLMKVAKTVYISK